MPPPQAGGNPALPNLRVSFYLCVPVHLFLHRNTKIDVVTHMGTGFVFRGSAIPHPRGEGSTASKFGEAYVTTPTFSKVTDVGRGVYLGVSNTSHPKTAEFQLFPFLGVLLYLCLHPLTQNNQIRYGNIMKERLDFRQSATPSIPRRRGPSGPKLCGISPAYMV